MQTRFMLETELLCENGERHPATWEFKRSAHLHNSNLVGDEVDRRKDLRGAFLDLIEANACYVPFRFDHAVLSVRRGFRSRAVDPFGSHLTQEFADRVIGMEYVHNDSASLKRTMSLLKELALKLRGGTQLEGRLRYAEST
jgi:hypothetical protein